MTALTLPTIRASSTIIPYILCSLQSTLRLLAASPTFARSTAPKESPGPCSTRVTAYAIPEQRRRASWYLGSCSARGAAAYGLRAAWHAARIVALSPALAPEFRRRSDSRGRFALANGDWSEAEEHRVLVLTQTNSFIDCSRYTAAYTPFATARPLRGRLLCEAWQHGSLICTGRQTKLKPIGAMDEAAQ